MIGSGPPRLNSQQKGDSFAPEVQRAGNKRKDKRDDQVRRGRDQGRRGRVVCLRAGQRTASGLRGDRCGPQEDGV